MVHWVYLVMSPAANIVFLQLVIINIVWKI